MRAFLAAAQLQLGPQLSLQSPLQPQPSTRRVVFSAPPRVVACAQAAAQQVIELDRPSLKLCSQDKHLAA